MRVVLVTGCRSGFGLLTAVHAARAGMRVYAGLRDPASGEALAEATRGLAVTPLELDVVDPEQRRDAVARVLREAGRLDALVNNAGVSLGGFAEQLDEDELRRVMEVNFFAVWALTREVLPAMRAQGEGWILNVSSISGVLALPGLGAYAASKHALEGLSEAMRHELRPFGVRVCLIEPGPYGTDIVGRNRVLGRRVLDPHSPYLPYALQAERLFNRILESGLEDANDVAAHIVRLIGAPSPALRHPMGRSARVRVLLKRLAPFGLIEWAIGRALRPQAQLPAAQTSSGGSSSKDSLE